VASVLLSFAAANDAGFSYLHAGICNSIEKVSNKESSVFIELSFKVNMKHRVDQTVV
jgi:hypothetical protein